MDKSFHLMKRIRSFQYAGAGIWIMLQTQHNAWIHAVATAGVCGAGWCVGLSAAEWCWIVLAIMAVWTAEAFNTALEFLADAVLPEFHPLIKKAKDVAAGAVLITALGAAIIGVLVFYPHIALLLRQGVS